jgi:DoxX-like family
MVTYTRNASVAVWLGRIASALVVLALLVDGALQLLKPELLRADMEKTGFAMNLSSSLGFIMVGCAIIYAIPRLAALGAILVTGFLGGIVCTHLRLGEIGSPPQFIALGLGILTWGGLFLRDARMRALLPFRTTPSASMGVEIIR